MLGKGSNTHVHFDVDKHIVSRGVPLLAPDHVDCADLEHTVNVAVAVSGFIEAAVVLVLSKLESFLSSGSGDAALVEAGSLVKDDDVAAGDAVHLVAVGVLAGAPDVDDAVTVDVGERFLTRG